MNKIILAFVCIFLCNSKSGIAQTYLGLSLGYDLSKIEEGPDADPDFFSFREKGFVVGSLSYGLRLNQPIGNRIGISFSSNYSVKEIEAWISNFVPIKSVKFNYLRSSLTLDWEVIRSLYIGVGPTFHILTNIRQVAESVDIEASFLMPKRQFGLNMHVGYKFKNFISELNFMKGLSISNSAIDPDLMKPLNSIGLSIYYMFKFCLCKD